MGKSMENIVSTVLKPVPSYVGRVEAGGFCIRQRLVLLLNYGYTV